MQSAAIACSASSIACGPQPRRPAVGTGTLLLPCHLSSQRGARRLVAVRAEETSTSQSDAPLAAEQMLAKNRKAKASKGGAAGGGSGGGGGMGASKAGPTVIAPLRDQALGGGPLTAEQKAEGGVVTVMAVLFLVILLEGIFLAASGFLSAELDQFAVDAVYPAFAPTVGVFLAISTAYGVWKTRGPGDDAKK